MAKIAAPGVKYLPPVLPPASTATYRSGSKYDPYARWWDERTVWQWRQRKFQTVVPPEYRDIRTSPQELAKGGHTPERVYTTRGRGSELAFWHSFIPGASGIFAGAVTAAFVRSAAWKYWLHPMLGSWQGRAEAGVIAYGLPSAWGAYGKAMGWLGTGMTVLSQSWQEGDEAPGFWMGWRHWWAGYGTGSAIASWVYGKTDRWLLAAEIARHTPVLGVLVDATITLAKAALPRLIKASRSYVRWSSTVARGYVDAGRGALELGRFDF